MRIIGEQVNELRRFSKFYVGKIKKVLVNAADTIEALSAELQVSNIEQSGNKELWKMAKRKGMKEVLFRGKRIDNEEWAEGDFVHMPGGRAAIITEDDFLDVDPETVCQYTGLTDKNGRKIFEGDIVRVFADCNDFGESNYYLYQIRWDKEYCAFEGYDIRTKETFLFPDLGENEIIGNIFDNPELCK